MATGLVVENAVIGVPDILLGNKIFAVSTPIDSKTTAEEILEQYAAKLPRYKLPSEIVIVKSLPKHPSGKVDRKKCKEQIH